MEAAESLKIGKLKQSSFRAWKQNVELMIAFLEPDDHISDPQAASDADELREWKRNDGKEKAVIGLRLVMSMLSMSSELKVCLTFEWSSWTCFKVELCCKA